MYTWMDTQTDRNKPRSVQKLSWNVPKINYFIIMLTHIFFSLQSTISKLCPFFLWGRMENCSNQDTKTLNLLFRCHRLGTLACSNSESILKQFFVSQALYWHHTTQHIHAPRSIQTCNSSVEWLKTTSVTNLN